MADDRTSRSYHSHETPPKADGQEAAERDMMIAGELGYIPLANVRLHPDWPYRKELGHLEKLMQSMGGPNRQIQPIGVDTSGYLIWGLRRFQAAKNLGWTKILARILDLPDPWTAMKEETENRLNLTTSEMTAIMRCLEANEQAKAKERQRPHGGTAPGRTNSSANVAEDLGNTCGNISTSDSGKARDAAAATFGLSGKTYHAMKKIDDHGTQKLKDAVDAGTITVSDAAKVATAPARVQDQAVQDVQDGSARTVAQAIGSSPTGPLATERKGGSMPVRPPKNGEERFKWREFQNHFGGLVRVIAKLASAAGLVNARGYIKQCPESRELERILQEFYNRFEQWYTKVFQQPPPER
jgi:hypothetical protein